MLALNESITFFLVILPVCASFGLLDLNNLPFVSRFSLSAKKLLEKYDLVPPPKVIEVDLRGMTPFYVSIFILPLLADDSNTIKAILTRLTGQSTFPNVMVRGHSIGGSDDIHELHAQKLLSKQLEEAGVVQRNDGFGQ
jgi:hypothetical protein